MPASLARMQLWIVQRASLSIACLTWPIIPCRARLCTALGPHLFLQHPHSRAQSSHVNVTLSSFSSNHPLRCTSIGGSLQLGVLHCTTLQDLHVSHSALVHGGNLQSMQTTQRPLSFYCATRCGRNLFGAGAPDTLGTSR